VTCAAIEAIVIEGDHEIIKIRTDFTFLKRQKTTITNREIRTLFDIVRNEGKIKRIWK